jgi:hypothetical protein
LASARRCRAIFCELAVAESVQPVPEALVIMPELQAVHADVTERKLVLRCQC